MSRNRRKRGFLQSWNVL